MKRTPKKLVLCSETLRTLRTLGNRDLVRAIGGVDSGDKPCAAVFDSGRIDCETAVVVIATAACR
jgi:hypothetical protein